MHFPVPRSFRVPFLRALFAATVGLSALTSCTNTLNRAIYREHPELVDKFMAEGADVNQANDKGGTPLIYAAQHGDLALIRKLVERGAKINWTDREGNSALSYLAASSTDKSDAVSFLLAQGADVNVANNLWQTPLHLAAKTRSPSNGAEKIAVIKRLLDAGANASLQTKNRELALHLAAAADQPSEVLDLILTATDNRQSLTKDGYSALSVAAQAGSHDAEIFLVNHGFSPQPLVVEAKTPAAVWPKLQAVPAINARTHEAVGDCSVAVGEQKKALESFRISATAYDDAVQNGRDVVAFYKQHLADAKAGRKGRIVATIAANVVGGGLVAATGVGFFAVPKRVNNHIDEYDEALKQAERELNTLTSDQSRLSKKLMDLENSRPADAVAALPEHSGDSIPNITRASAN